MEVRLGAIDQELIDSQTFVLILVLVEVRLGAGTKLLLALAGQCLNPCFGGS